MTFIERFSDSYQQGYQARFNH